MSNKNKGPFITSDEGIFYICIPIGESKEEANKMAEELFNKVDWLNEESDFVDSVEAAGLNI